MTIQKIVCALTVVSLAACGGGGGGGGTSIPPNTVVPAAKGSAIFTLKVPSKSAQLRPHKRNALTPDYQSPATLGIGIGISLTTPPAVQSPTVAFDLSTCTANNNCVANADGSRTYTLTGPLEPTGTYNVNIATWDVAPTAGTFPAGTAHELSDGITTSAITAVNTNVNVTLNGIPSTVVAVPIPGQLHVAQDAQNGLEIIGDAATQWSIAALDNDGYVIAGNGAPIMTFSDATNSLMAAAVATQSNLYTITAAHARSTSVALSISAKGVGPSGVTAATPGTVSILPVQELWETVSNPGATGQGIFGFLLDPTVPTSSGNFGVYMPPAPANNDTFSSMDALSTATQNFQALAQDSSGALWAYDSVGHTIDQFLIGTSGTQPLIATGVEISTTGQTIVAMAGDRNGFLYTLDQTAQAINVYTVTSGTPALKFHVLLGGPAGNDLSIVPNVASLPTGIAGSIVLATDQGVAFYSNASTGAPAPIGAPIPGEISTNINRAAVSPDDGILWTNESTEGNEISFYTITSATPTIAFQNDTSLYNNDNGPLAPAIVDYVYSAGGTEFYGLSQYIEFDGGLNDNNHCGSACAIGNGASSPEYLGAFVAP